MRIIIWRAGEVWFDCKHGQTLVLSLQYISLKRYKHFLCLCQSCKTKILTVKFGVYFFAVVLYLAICFLSFCAFAVSVLSVFYLFLWEKSCPSSSFQLLHYRRSRVVVAGKTKAAQGCFRSFRWRLLRLKGPFSRRQ